MMDIRWVLDNDPIPHLRVEGIDGVIALFSTKSGLSFLKKYGISDFCHLKQVHGSRISLVSERNCPRGNVEGDGLMVMDKGIFVGVRVADCYPVFLFNPKQEALTLLHAGWRGLKNGILDRAVGKMRKHGIEIESTLVFIGPGISWFNYEIGEDVAKFFPGFVVKKGGKLYLDLHRFIFERLVELGIDRSSILPSPFCTYSHPELFHSKRREGKPEGYMWAVAGII